MSNKKSGFIIRLDLTFVRVSQLNALMPLLLNSLVLNLVLVILGWAISKR